MMPLTYTDMSNIFLFKLKSIVILIKYAVCFTSIKTAGAIQAMLLNHIRNMTQ